MKLKIVMADPAGNRTAIVRSPVPPHLRADTAAKILGIRELGAEQAGFETAPLYGGAGRLEMMGGEFCGNAARSFGYLLWSESAAGKKSRYGERQNFDPERDAVPAPVRGNIRIEISGHTGLLRVSCDGEAGTSFAQMPMPQRLEWSEEGYPMVVSEGITHMILEDLDPDPELVRRLADRYGPLCDAFGMMFLRGDRLVPVVCVAAAGSLVYESSCGSGSLASAWYLFQKEKTGKHRDPLCIFHEAGNTEDSPDLLRVQEPGSPEEALYTFREPGGEIQVRFSGTGQENLTGHMGGKVRIGQELEVTI